MRPQKGNLWAATIALTLFAACGGDPSALGPGEIQPQIAACLEDAGFNVDQLGPRPTGELQNDSPWASPQVLAAHARCIVETGLGEIEGDEPEEVAAQNEKAIAMTNCLRQSGWEIDDPERHPAFGYLLPPTPTIPTDPAAADALMDDMLKCADEAGIEIEVKP